jgi:hypothetical protein
MEVIEGKGTLVPNVLWRRVILPIVYLLMPSGHIVDTLSPMRGKARADIQPIYIYKNTNTFIYMVVKKTMPVQTLLIFLL